MAMTPADREAKVEALKPAWAKDYIRQLEALTRDLAVRIQDAFGVNGQSTAAPGLELSPEATAVAWRALDMMDGAAFSEGDDEVIQQVAAHFGAQLPARPDEVAPVPPRPPAYPEGIAPPGDGYADIRILDGSADMEPVADLTYRAEIRYGDFFQVHLTALSGDEAGSKVLVIEGEGELAVSPVDPATIIIRRA
jgi:hypothetical protein